MSKEKILMVLVVVSLVLSVFSLVLTFRSNGPSALVGQSSNVTWKKVNLATSQINYMHFMYGSYVPLWNITLTLEWSNGTVRSYDLGDTIPTNGGGSYTFQCLAKGTGYNNRDGELEDTSYNFAYGQSPTANITSLTAYEIQSPQ